MYVYLSTTVLTCDRQTLQMDFTNISSSAEALLAIQLGVCVEASYAPEMVRKAVPHMMLQIHPSSRRKVRRNCSSATPLFTHTTPRRLAPCGRTCAPHRTVSPDTKVPAVDRARVNDQMSTCQLGVREK